jgi:predicted ATPase/class 3 adenylate cyclase
MSNEQRQLEAAIHALEAQRALLGDAVVDASVAGLRVKLAALSAADVDGAQALKQVSILFLDVVGSTRLSEHLDPEDIQSVIDGLLMRCTRSIESHGGRVLQYAGDNILAAFGAEVTQEDDAERALLAGLELLVLGREQGAEVLRRFGQPGFDVRLGVHTGSVLLGGGVDAEGSIRGMAVNVAARLEQLAPPGALRISRETWLHVRGLFEMEEQAPLAMKGLQEPVVTFLVKRALPRTFRDARRGIEGLSTPLIGRDAELAQLLSAHDDVVAERRLRGLTVIADAGVGKSRLLAEFEQALASRPSPMRCWHARSHPHSRQQAFGLVRDLFCRRFGIAESDDLATAQAKLQQGLTPLAGERAEEAAALIGQLVGLDFSANPHVAGILSDTRQVRLRAQHLAGELLHRAAHLEPGGVVLLLDDLHWADDASLDFIEEVARQAADAPVLLLCGARPSLHEHRPRWGEPLPRHQALELAAMTDHGAALADALLAPIQEPPAVLRELLLQQSDGNPFYMEELLLMLIDDGVVDTRRRPWTVQLERLGALRVPTTLTGVMQARIDSLPSSDRRSLQQASVIGSVFWGDALRAVAGTDGTPDDDLRALEHRGTVRQRDSTAFAGTREYSFRHHLLHQVTYGTVLKHQRQPMHRRTAQWLTAAAGERIGEHAALIADHFERAGDAAEAVSYFRRAAEAAQAASAPAMALVHIERARRLVPDSAWRERFELNVLRVQAHNILGQRDVQAALVAEQLALADQLDDDRCRAVAHAEQSCLLVVTGEFTAAIDAARRAHEFAEAVGEPGLALVSSADTGHALRQLGRQEEAAAVLRQTVELAGQLGRADVEIIALNRLSTVARAMGRVAEQLACLEQAIELADRTGNLRVVAAMRGNLGAAETRWGRFERAQELIQSALVTQRAIGDRGSQGYTMWQLMTLHACMGDRAAALQAGEQALALAVEVRDRGMESGLLTHTATLAAEHGDFDRADDWLDRLDRLGTKAPDAPEPTTLLPRAMSAHGKGLQAEATERIRDWVRWLERPDGDLAGAEVQQLWQGCTLLRDCGLQAEFERVLARAWRLLRHSEAELPRERRNAFMSRIPYNRAVAEAWVALHPGPAGPP